MERVVGYCRVSSAEQTNGTSMAHQEAQIRAYCSFKGHDLVEVFKDPGVSGGKAIHTRPGGSAMIERLSHGDITGVITLKLDRAFRSALDCQITVAQWEKSGITLHFTDMGGIPIDSSTTMGKFMLQVISSCAELERNMIADRCRAGRKATKEMGKPVGGLPFGYRKNDKGYLVPDQGEQQIIAEIKTLHKDGLSLNGIAKELNSRGIPTKTGGGTWAAAQIQRILKVA